ncbi:MAG: hypothetical protein IAF02_08965, partial [Anaerolineae bacterium]|nr:hypothetical protein [Anaerolineae bacterium]
ETARTRYPHERDYVRAHWLLGWAALVQGSYPESQSRLDEALRRCRAINMVDHEPAILLAQARLARAVGAGLVPAPSPALPESGRPQEPPLQRSLDYAQQALTVAQRSGFVLDLADIHNHLALLALDASDTAAARSAARAHAQSARDYAYCDGPPFAYHTALTEAERILALLNESGRGETGG